MNIMKNKKIVIIFLIVTIALIVGLYSFLTSKRGQEINFEFNDTNLQLRIGETKQIDYIYDEVNNPIKWQSSNDVVSVDDDGVVTANKYGNGTIIGTVISGGNVVSKTCHVTVYTGNMGTSLEELIIPEGYLLMKPDSSIDIPVTIIPYNAYITSVSYFSDDENIITVDNDKILSNDIGSATFTVTINNQLSRDIPIIVSNDVTENKFVQEAESVSINEQDVIMEIGDTQVLTYNVKPYDGYVNNVEWISSDINVISVIDGVINAVNKGEAVVKVIINGKIESAVNVTVKASNANIIVNNSPKTTIRIGERTTVKASIYPDNVNDVITYESSNSNVAIVNSGVITGVGQGTSTITLSIGNGKRRSFTINVLPLKGSINGKGNLWGYKSLNVKIPVYANQAFYQNLAANGIGVFKNNKYVISKSGETYTYDISASTLYVNNKKILVRIYYPPGEDLSSLNTLTYMGGIGSKNFSGTFNNIHKNPSMAKSAGILILVPEGNDTLFSGEAGAYATKFVKAITNQKSNVKNSILGFSHGANKVLHSASSEDYDKIIIFSGFTDDVESVVNAKNKEVIVIIATKDSGYEQARSTLSNMMKSGYKNVTVISNSGDMASRYGQKFLAINVGSLMKNGHYSENVFTSGIIEYAND